MAAVQLMCARLGMVTGRGVAGVIRERFPRWVLLLACSLLIIANTINIGADLGGMAKAMEMMTGVTQYLWLPLFAGLIVSLLTWTRYKHIVRIFKWLTLVLLAYVGACFLSHPKWADVVKATFLPDIRIDSRYLSTFVAILGTTISPYLFFWQAAQEVEEEKAIGRDSLEARRGATTEELKTARRDVLTGMAYSNAIMYFIILTTGATLFAAGHRDIETAREAAEALRPLAGEGAYLLFGIGLIGTGILGVPVLAGSAAYAVAESMDWGGSLDDRPRLAPRFYAVVAVSVVLGLALCFMGFDAIKMLFWAAVINGALAPPLIAIVTLLSSDPRVMGERVNTRLVRWLGWLTTLVMTAATIAMLIW
jgi:NRAMP (natural resistance-associated macrophage protein)-like metal ion transporter